jgi:tyrosyl-tRNA synthetase
MWEYYRLLTDVPESEIAQMKKASSEGTNPMEFKKKLGELLVNWLHPQEGRAAREKWEAEKIGARQDKMVLPPDTPVFHVPPTMQEDGKAELARILVSAGVEASMSAVKRLIESGSIKIGESLQTVKDAKMILSFPGEYAVRIGKKKYLVIRG